MTFNHDGGSARGRLVWLLGVVGLLSILFLIVWWPGCRQYPAVTSKEALYLIKLLYTACNTNDEKRLRQVEQGVERLIREGKLSSAEEQAFRKIIGMADAGKWDEAEKSALKFAQDQIGQGSSDPIRQADHKHR